MPLFPYFVVKYQPFCSLDSFESFELVSSSDEISLAVADIGSSEGLSSCAWSLEDADLRSSDSLKECVSFSNLQIEHVPLKTCMQSMWYNSSQLKHFFSAASELDRHVQNFLCSFDTKGGTGNLFVSVLISSNADSPFAILTIMFRISPGLTTISAGSTPMQKRYANHTEKGPQSYPFDCC